MSCFIVKKRSWPSTNSWGPGGPLRVHELIISYNDFRVIGKEDSNAVIEHFID